MIQRLVVLGMIAMLIIAGVSCGESGSGKTGAFTEYPPMDLDAKTDYALILTTSAGRITLKLLPEEAPLAVNSLVFLANQGFYDGITFHRVLPGILAETGDPTGTGTGDAGYTFEIEPSQRPYERGTLAMANTDESNSNSSRFFIILGDVTTNDALPGTSTVVGHIKRTEDGAHHKPSLRTLEKIEAVALGPNANGEVSAPLEPIELISITVNLGCATSGGQYGGSWAGGDC